MMKISHIIILNNEIDIKNYNNFAVGVSSFLPNYNLFLTVYQDA